MKNSKLCLGIICSLLFFSGNTFSQEKNSKLNLLLYNIKEKKYKNVEIIKTSGVLVNLNCLETKDSKSCMALTALKSKPISRYITSTTLAGNPAARNCYSYGATNRILLDEKKNEFDYCVFSDGSMIDAWSFFYIKNGR